VEFVALELFASSGQPLKSRSLSLMQMMVMIDLLCMEAKWQVKIKHLPLSRRMMKRGSSDRKLNGISLRSVFVKDSNRTFDEIKIKLIHKI